MLFESVSSFKRSWGAKMWMVLHFYIENRESEQFSIRVNYFLEEAFNVDAKTDL
jgi:hypothetical protein